MVGNIALVPMKCILKSMSEIDRYQTTINTRSFYIFRVVCCILPLLNSLSPGRFEKKIRQVIYKLILVIDGWTVSCYIVLIWLSSDLPEETSILVQVMAWCRQATSHYLNQCWPRSPTPYGATRPQWVKMIMYIKWSLMAIKIYLVQNTTWISPDVKVVSSSSIHNATQYSFNAPKTAIKGVLSH